MTQETLILGLTIATLAVAAIAAVSAVLAFRLKSGLEIRGNFSVTSSIYCEDRYVSSVALENMKDRSVTVFEILIELDHGYYIVLEDFETDPLILGPFETIVRRYDPIDQYSVNMRRIHLDELFSKKGVRLRLVLATSAGRYNVKHYIDRWNPLGDCFRNHLTAVIRPHWSTYKGSAYGSGTKYIVRLIANGLDDEIIPIHPRDHTVRKFRDFRLTPESLESREALETFLLERAVEGDLPCTDLEVLDLGALRAERYAEYEDKGSSAARRGWLVYHLAGWLVTKWHEFQLRWQNRRNRVQQAKKLRELHRSSGRDE